MAGSFPTIRSHAAVQQIIKRLRNQSNRVIITSVKTSSKEAQAILPVTITHLPDLRGHFPGNPIVPGVVMLEAMFQLAAVLADEQGNDTKIDYVKEARFRRIVTPRDVELRIKVWDEPSGYRGIAEAGKVMVAEAVFGD